MSLLNDKWTYWFDEVSEKSAKYQNNLQILEEFDTIEKFWQIFNSLPEISKIPQNCSLILMKKDIKPQWEDSGNYYGQIAKYKVEEDQVVQLWKELNMFLISLEFSDDYDDENINGIIIKVKQPDNFILEIWTKTKYVEENFKNSFLNNTKNFFQFNLEKIRTYNCADLIKSHKIKSKKIKKN